MPCSLLFSAIRRNLARSFICLAVSLVFCSVARPQTLPPSGSMLHDRNAANSDIMVYLVTDTGEPFTEKFSMRLTPTDILLNSNGYRNFARSTQGGWLFEYLMPDTYRMSITAKGYQDVLEEVVVPASGQTTNTIVVMRSVDETVRFQPPGGHFLLSPRVEKEVQKSVKDLQQSRYASARKHLNKVFPIAEANPYVNYVMGISYLMDENLAQARPYLEKSVSIDSRQVPALLALGNLRYQSGDCSGAIRVAEDAVQLDPTSWRSHWILADCYLRESDFQKALDHSTLALQEGRKEAGQAKLLVGEADAGLGRREDAVKFVSEFLTENPRYLLAPTVRSWLEGLKNSSDSSSISIPKELNGAVLKENVAAAPAPSVEVPPKADWAPPDIDAEKPFQVSGAVCSLPDVMARAQKHAEELVSDLQSFSAREEYQTVEVNHNGGLDTPEKHTFEYMATVGKPYVNGIPVQELRSPYLTPDEMPAGIVEAGAASLALVFHSAYRQDFDWTCEGLSEWNSQPTWIVRFQQTASRPTSMLSALNIGASSYNLPIKGRAWINANDGAVVHLESDLLIPMTALGLEKQHFVVDYAPFLFRSHKVELWLPAHVDLYLHYKRHYVHYRDDYSQFHLFWVGASQKIGKPKEVSQPKDVSKPAKSGL